MSNYEQIRKRATPINVQLRWSDQDTNGHINSARIVTLMEEARIRAIQHWFAETPGSGTKRLVRALNSTFDREVHYGKETKIWVWIPRVGNSSLVVGHLLTQDKVPCIYMETTMVVVDSTSGKPKRHDKDYRRQLKEHFGPSYSASEE